MKILCVHAHFDDFEFVAGGTFTLWQHRLGKDLTSRILVCTDGKAGHQFRTRQETAELRFSEQEASAKIGGYEFRPLRLPDGRMPREACLMVDVPLLAALWNEIREFEPDYLFCPPLPADPLAGIHVDHVAVAEAVRKVAYMINVPHAFTPEYLTDETDPKPCRVPVILNVHDAYQTGSNRHDLAVDVEGAFEQICEMSYCHQSQIAEWLPWVGRHQIQAPLDRQDWSRILRDRFAYRNAHLGIQSERALEFFTVTAWGAIPTFEQLMKDFPSLAKESSHLDQLKEKLARWNGPE